MLLRFSLRGVVRAYICGVKLVGTGLLWLPCTFGMTLYKGMCVCACVILMDCERKLPDSGIVDCRSE